MKVDILSGTSRLETLQHEPSEDVGVDEVKVINGRVCIAYDDMIAGDPGNFVHACEHMEFPNAADEAFNEGEPIYFDEGDDQFHNADDNGRIKCGMVLKSVGSSDDKVKARLDNTVNL